MAQALELSVVALGIEEEAEENFLRDNKCQIGQGFRFGKPIVVDDFESQYLEP